MGLRLLSEKSSLRVPGVVALGTIDQTRYLILEWIDKGRYSGNFWSNFGEKLAQQHRISASTFGLAFDNHIGRLPQSNSEHTKWIDFFQEERIRPQLKLARDSQLIDKTFISRFELFFKKIADLIPAEPPALVHGDLWSGNFMSDESGEPLIFDPAVYYGHREMDIAFTTLFGGFDPQFYDAYQNYYPLEKGFEERIEIHNIYPLLVHVNLFGPSYLHGIKGTLARYV
jgi:fructosamine-3-kinase